MAAGVQDPRILIRDLLVNRTAQCVGQHGPSVSFNFKMAACIGMLEAPTEGVQRVSPSGCQRWIRFGIERNVEVDASFEGLLGMRFRMRQELGQIGISINASIAVSKQGLVEINRLIEGPDRCERARVIREKRECT